MDALSKIFDDIHLNQTEYLYLQTQGDWAFHIPEQSALIAHIILFGQAQVFIQDQLKIDLKAGDIILIPAGLEHKAQNIGQTKLIQSTDISKLFDGLKQDAIQFGQGDSNKALILTVRCHMDAVMAKPLVNALPPYLHIQNAFSDTAPEWLKIGLYFVASETQRSLAGRNKIMDHLVSIMFIECVRDYIEHLTDQNNWLNALIHPELARALAAIHSFPERSWTVESLAEQCFMSRSKFSSLFNQIVGTSPLAYLQQHRLRLATQFLRQGHMSIQQIAHQVGYSSETSFSQAFKKQFEVSPSQYKQNA
ncbi:AraC family transcriptional regulator [Acinetobacter stercoris]|uniref:Virulence regulon transcriptional activator VirF n=1 Tax=Acinetobacter stercoris TaxID=2126983 RepID=A0A2U3N0V7_9GAMM|nr:AraC family transcriptional regulator [Acinetobacter stercoris]SPL71310.1 Virulence regulon transcriptional activator VirF [Acinetobacter stercoris]